MYLTLSLSSRKNTEIPSNFSREVCYATNTLGVAMKYFNNAQGIPHHQVDVEERFTEEDIDFIRTNYHTFFKMAYLADLLKILMIRFHPKNEDFCFVRPNGK